MRQFVLLAILCALAAAVGYDAIEGPGGLRAKQELEALVKNLEADLHALKRQRERLEHDAALLGDGADKQPALLEEQARTLLDLAHPSDIIIIDDRHGVR